MSFGGLTQFLDAALIGAAGPKTRTHNDHGFVGQSGIVIQFYVRIHMLYLEDEKEIFASDRAPVTFMKHIEPARCKEEEMLRARHKLQWDYLSEEINGRSMIEKFGVVIEAAYTYFLNFYADTSHEKKNFEMNTVGGVIWSCYLLATCYHISEECSRRLYLMYVRYYNTGPSAKGVYLSFLKLINYNLSHKVYCPVLCHSPQYEMYQNDAVRKYLERELREEFKNETYYEALIENKKSSAYDCLQQFCKDTTGFEEMPRCISTLLSLVVETEAYIQRLNLTNLDYDTKISHSKLIGQIQIDVIYKQMQLWENKGEQMQKTKKHFF